MTDLVRSVDVAILGGGLAGNLLARQLRRTLPDLSVAVFERDTARGWKVGEATVEISATYLTRRLGLTRYLYERQLPKNGLRFFFDTEARDAELHTMSEIGLSGLPPYPSFQLDRARLEGDLLEMNRADGVDVRVGARVADLSLADGQSEHTFRVVEEGGSTEWKARWVIDATGRAGTISKLKNLRMPEKSHRITAVWGRFSNVTDMDDWHDRAFLERARYTARYLSTVHFCYPGQWIWFIPLREGVVSVGVVCEPHMIDRGCYEEAGFLEYLDRHRAPRDLLANAEMLDMAHFTQLAFRTKQFFSTERWACIGDAAAFTDPFYSPGSDFISVENDLVTDLIRREIAGEELAERVQAYDEFMQFRFDTTLLLYDQLYPTFGSFELFRAKAFFDCALYYNLWFDSYVREEHTDLKAVQGILRRKAPVIAAMENFRALFRGAASTLMKRGDYYRKNLGHGVLNGMDAFGPLLHVGEKRKRPEVDRRTEEIFNLTAQRVQAMLDGEDKPFSPRPLYEYSEASGLGVQPGAVPASP